MTADEAKSEPANALLEHCILQLNNGHTAKAYRHDLNQLLDFISTLGASAQTLTAEQVHAYIASLSDHGLAPRSVRRRISAARSFYRYLQTKQVVSCNPFANVQMPAIDLKPTTLPVLSEEEIEDCLQVLIDEVKAILHASEDGASSRSLRRRTFYAMRRRAIVVLFVHSDIRPSELLHLLLTSVEQTATGFQLAITGTGRIIPISTDCLPELIDWIKIRSDIPTTANHLFVGYDGAPCTRMSIRQIMKWLQVRVRTPHALSPELFRRSFLQRQVSV